MRVGMFTSGYQRNPLEHCFMDAKRFGYDFIELWGGRPHAYAIDLKGGEINELKKLIDKYEIPVLGYTPEHNAYPYNFMIGSEMQRKDAISYLKLSLEMAKEMNAEFMLISPGHAGYYALDEEIWNRLVQSIEELTQYAEKLKTKLIVETLTPYETNVFKSSNDLGRLLKRIDSEYLQGMCDVVPPYVQYESIMSYIEKHGDKVSHMHIIDGEQGSENHIIPGEGSIPLVELFKELKDINYRGTATLELVTGYINEPRLYARRAIDNVKSMMKQAKF